MSATGVIRPIGSRAPSPDAGDLSLMIRVLNLGGHRDQHLGGRKAQAFSGLDDCEAFMLKLVPLKWSGRSGFERAAEGLPRGIKRSRCNPIFMVADAGLSQFKLGETSICHHEDRITSRSLY